MNLVSPGLQLKLPATSANLGPAFDAAGLALSLSLNVEAAVAEEFSLRASGRDGEVCERLEGNLIVETYCEVLRSAALPAQPLALSLANEIPLGMGCGSSAAALLAGVMLASHFGELGWSDARIVNEASRREGHPDNVAACWYGGFTVSAQHGVGDDMEVSAVSFPGDPQWRLLLALQATQLPTRQARALLPEHYSRADAVQNVQRASLLTAAFARGRLDLLRTATEDRLHQPFRLEACPLLDALLPMRSAPGIAAITLSGAGPSVLIFVAEGADATEVAGRLRGVLDSGTELLQLKIASGASRTVLAG